MTGHGPDQSRLTHLTASELPCQCLVNSSHRTGRQNSPFLTSLPCSSPGTHDPSLPLFPTGSPPTSPVSTPSGIHCRSVSGALSSGASASCLHRCSRSLPALPASPRPSYRPCPTAASYPFKVETEVDHNPSKRPRWLPARLGIKSKLQPSGYRAQSDPASRLALPGTALPGRRRPGLRGGGPPVHSDLG